MSSMFFMLYKPKGTKRHVGFRDVGRISLTSIATMKNNAVEVEG